MVNKNYVRTTRKGQKIFKRKDGNVYYEEEAQDMDGNLLRLGDLIDFDPFSFDSKADKPQK